MAKTKQTKPVVEFPHVPYPTRKRGKTSAEAWRRRHATQLAQATEIFWELVSSGSMTREQFEACLARMEHLHVVRATSSLYHEPYYGPTR